MIEEYNELYAGKDMTLYVNGNPANNIGDNTWTTTEDYMEQFYNKVLSKIDGRKIFSTDIYPLLETRGVYTLDSRWLRTMAVYANYAKDYDGEFHMFIQNYSSSINRETLSARTLPIKYIPTWRSALTAILTLLTASRLYKNSAAVA